MRLKLLVALMVLVGGARCFAADPYPSKAVRLIVPFAPGGSSDITARVLAQQLSVQLGKPLVVDNRVGAAGTIGNAIAAKSTPDGYTLMMMDNSTTIVPSLYKSLPFDVTKDFTAITRIMNVPNVLIVSRSLTVSSLKEFVALAQNSPGKLNYGSAGKGTINQLSAELFVMAAKVDIKHIPYKGGGEVLAAVLGGQVAMLIAPVPTVFAMVESGKIRALAVTTSDGRRSRALPDVPSMSEAGIPNLNIYTWNGLVGPSGMPEDIVRKLYVEAVNAMKMPTVRDRFFSQGIELASDSPREFAEHIRAEFRRWAEVVRVANITLE